MTTVLLIAGALFYLLVPSLVIRLCRRVPFFGKMGAILTLYFLGVIVANLGIFPFEGVAEALFPLQDALTSATILLAIPMILFACDFRNWPAGRALVSLGVGVVSVVAVVVAGYFVFRGHLGPLGPAIAGMAVGVYTGGTPNLASIKMMLGVDERTYVLMNSFDMLVSFVYLAFLLSVGIRLVRRFLPAYDRQSGCAALNAGKNPAGEGIQRSTAGLPQTAAERQGGCGVAGAFPEGTDSRSRDAAPGLTAVDGANRMALGESEMYRGIFTRAHFGKTLLSLGLAVLIAGAAVGLSFLLTGKVNMVVVILTLTTLALGVSFVPAVRRWEKSYDAGMYLVLVFSLVVASMVDVRSIDYNEGLYLLLYIAFTIFGSLALQLLLSRLFKVDADTAVITSVAMINSPLFVPMIADAMKNRRVILTGITIGIIGYAVGNYLGVLLAGIL